MNDEFSDVDFLKDPWDWPAYPVCPVKSITTKDKESYPLMGFVVAGVPTVYIKNMFSLEAGKDLESQLDGVDKKEYASFVDMVGDGWIVD